jgi:hypothetical protein
MGDIINDDIFEGLLIRYAREVREESGSISEKYIPYDIGGYEFRRDLPLIIAIIITVG